MMRGVLPYAYVMEISMRMDLLESTAMLEQFGITDRNFVTPFYSQLIEADGFGGDGLEFVAAVIKNEAPKDCLQAMAGRTDGRRALGGDEIHAPSRRS
jgi:hypothetical protein